MATVHYQGKTITDPHLHELLQRVADHLDRDVRIVGGNRAADAQQKGGSQTSLHFPQYGGRAADFHVDGITDRQAFDNLRAHASEVFDHDKTYELVQHGRDTNTDKAHLHIGRYGPEHAKTAQYPGTVLVKTEGLTPGTRGVYDVKPVPLQDLHRQQQVTQSPSATRETASSKSPGPAASTRDATPTTKSLNDIKRDLGERYGGSSAAAQSKSQQPSKAPDKAPEQSKEQAR